MSKVGDRNQRILTELTKLNGNSTCCDCGSRDTSWASINLGCFLCILCSSIHRKIGTQVSRIKSVEFDSWTKEQVEVMRANGNILVNAKYNPDPSQNRPPIEYDPEERNGLMEKWIRSKYETRSFMIKAQRARATSTVEIRLGGGQRSPVRAASLPTIVPTITPTPPPPPPMPTLVEVNSNRPRSVTLGASPARFNPSIWDDMSSLSLGTTQGSPIPPLPSQESYGTPFQPSPTPHQQPQSYFPNPSLAPIPAFPGLPRQNSSLYPAPSIGTPVTQLSNPFSALQGTSFPTNPFYTNGYPSNLPVMVSPSLNPYHNSAGGFIQVPIQSGNPFLQQQGTQYQQQQQQQQYQQYGRTWGS